MFNEVGLEGLSSLSWNISGGLWPVPIHWNYTHWITWCKSNASSSSSSYIYCPFFCYSINKGALEHLKGHDIHAIEIAGLFLVKREMRCSPWQLLCSSWLGRRQEGSLQSLDEWLTSGIHHVHIRIVGTWDISIVVNHHIRMWACHGWFSRTGFCWGRLEHGG